MDSSVCLSEEKVIFSVRKMRAGRGEGHLRVIIRGPVHTVGTNDTNMVIKYSIRLSRFLDEQLDQRGFLVDHVWTVELKSLIP